MDSFDDLGTEEEINCLMDNHTENEEASNSKLDLLPSYNELQYVIEELHSESLRLTKFPSQKKKKTNKICFFPRRTHLFMF